MKDIIITIFLVLLMARNILKNKETVKIIKKLKKTQLAGIALSFVFTVLTATVLIYYGGNWIAGQFSNSVLRYLVFGVIVLMVLYVMGTV